MTTLRKSRRKPRLSPEKLAAMADLLREPFPNYAEIARNLGVSVTLVCQHARRFGLPSRREKAVKHYEKIEKQVGEVGHAGAARKLGVSRQCVHACLGRLARMRGEG